ncbi:MAG: hypothetical protein II882_06355 [Lachnospiraceae bacterium]|nr:hypothetical protein [Lachnospiraceae bacterium]
MLRKERTAGRMLRFLCLLLLCFMMMPLTARALNYGRAYHPPAITVIMPHYGDETEVRVTMYHSSGESFTMKLEKERRVWEDCFRLFRYAVYEKDNWYGNTVDFKDAVLLIQEGEKTYTFPIPYQELKANDFDDYLVIDLKEETLRVGIPLGRTLALFFMHLAVYLVVEAIVFFLFKIRSKRSWLLFLAYTAVTKGIMCFVIRGWLNVNPRVNIIFGAVTCMYVAVDLAFFLVMLEEPRNYVSKAAVFGNLLAAQAMYEVIKYLPM